MYENSMEDQGSNVLQISFCSREYKTLLSQTDSTSGLMHPFFSAERQPLSPSPQSHFSWDGHSQVSKPPCNPWGFQIEIPPCNPETRKNITKPTSVHCISSRIAEVTVIYWFTQFWFFSQYGIGINSGSFSSHQFHKSAASWKCA